MDRWSERDTETGVGLDATPHALASRVTQLGLGGFVRADAGTSQKSGEQEVKAKIEVVASRRVRRQKEAAATAPIAPAGIAPRAASVPSTSGFSPPAWAGTPPPGYSLQVLKGGANVDDIELGHAALLFGRGASCDQVLDHPSISRQHAAVCYRPSTEKWFVVDLGSVHHTFVDQRPVDKHVPVELKPGSTVRFAASTRDYVLHALVADRKRGAGGEPNGDMHGTKAPDQKRVRFAGGTTNAAALEEVIGYSDGRSFAINVGPSRDVAPGEGRFASLVKTSRAADANVLEGKKASASGTDGLGNALAKGNPVSGERRALPATPGMPRVPAAATQPFQGKKLYDWLPPARQAGPD